jgi:uncharacterized protein (TIGR03435 family)
MLSILVLLVFAPTALPAETGATEAPWAYDVVSIKLEAPDVGAVGIRKTPTGFEAYMVTLKDLVVGAYGLKDPSLVANAPDWKTRYHVIAKLDGDRVAMFNALPPEQQSEKSQQMLQALLAEYFHLRIHHDTKALAVYSLTADQHGLKLKEVAPAGQTPTERFFEDGKIVGPFSIAQLVHLLNVGHVHGIDTADRPVVDETGLKGEYQFNLAWDTPSGAGTQGNDRNAVSYGSLESALVNAAGLKLVPKKIQADAIVVDHAEEPTLN